MNTYNMDKMYESYADTVERMQMWLDESEQENKKYKEVIDKAINYIYDEIKREGFHHYLDDKDIEELLDILKGVNNSK